MRKFKILKVVGVFFTFLSWLFFILYVIACSLTKDEIMQALPDVDTKWLFIAFLLSFLAGLMLYNYGYYLAQKHQKKLRKQAELKRKIERAKLQEEETEAQLNEGD